MGAIILFILIYFLFISNSSKDKNSTVEVQSINEIIGLPERFYEDFSDESLGSDITICFFKNTKIIINKKLKNRH